MLHQKRKIWAWCLYDLACSAFPIIVITFIFATYFTRKVAANEIMGTYQWSRAMAVASLLIAILSPFFGSIADHSGGHKRWLFLFTLICVMASASLWYVYPGTSSVPLMLTCVVIGTISAEMAIVFYNSFLPHIAPATYLGRISGWAWGLGYWGGIAALSIVLFGFIKVPPAWINTITAEEVRICGPFTAIWFALFSLPLFLFIPDTPRNQLPLRQAISVGLTDLLSTLKSLPQEKNLSLYLIAHLIYADGINTLLAFGGIYAAGTFHMTLAEVILFGICMNLSAGIGAICFAWADDYFGSKCMIVFSLGCLFLFGIGILLTKTAFYFWLFGLTISLFFGPVQAASRTLMARLSPVGKSTEMFGFYAFSGRVAAFTGPWLLGITTLYFHSQRAGIATILIFFMVGGLLLCFVKEPRRTRAQLKLAKANDD